MNNNYRKKPVVIEAVQNVSETHPPIWLQEATQRGDVIVQMDGSLIIKTLEGDHLCQQNDWIIRGIKGELYPCKPDIFAATYEAVDSPTQYMGEEKGSGNSND